MKTPNFEYNYCQSDYVITLNIQVQIPILVQLYCRCRSTKFWRSPSLIRTQRSRRRVLSSLLSIHRRTVLALTSSRSATVATDGSVKANRLDPGRKFP